MEKFPHPEALVIYLGEKDLAAHKKLTLMLSLEKNLVLLWLWVPETTLISVVQTCWRDERGVGT